MASNSDIEQNKPDGAGDSQSIGLGFLPSALGTSTTGVPTQRTVSPTQDEEESEQVETEEVDAPLRSRVVSSASRSLANRVKKPVRTRSALEVLEASKVQKTRVPPAPSKKSPDTQSRVSVQTSSAPKTSEEILRDTFGTFELRTVYRIENLQVNKALWASHHARAVDAADYELCVATRAMRQALGVEDGRALRACRVRSKGKEYAVWINVDSGATICVLSPADVYLMGWVSDS